MASEPNNIKIWPHISELIEVAAEVKFWSFVQRMSLAVCLARKGRKEAIITGGCKLIREFLQLLVEILSV